ncbi:MULTISPECIES: two-component system sensor histidine kinase Hik34 [unclassified Synechocystis]|uniref:two-component system sensor histidine kinase Hik34 n=1 Tax=unclassified Synechocystis TaxID=2640012 RepID=UPI000410805A|nr:MULTISPECIES: two-component system sensor histidine kinase Hik34 [unclassified Synechocystis]AIE73910.1 Sensory transduction protein kinase [Synechocystis sp. PCC 6714]MCT0252484.1 HAMP domain-containing histidine kinase [Synechocystis sp. CS-94]
MNEVCLKLSDLFVSSGWGGYDQGRAPQWAHPKAQQQWFGAIAALEPFLRQTLPNGGEELAGICLASPAPVLKDPLLTQSFYQGIAVPTPWEEFSPLPCLAGGQSAWVQIPRMREIPLFPRDPLAEEQFCWLMTPKFGLLLLLGKNEQGLTQFYWSFDPEILQRAWLSLQTRLRCVFSPDLPFLEKTVADFDFPTPDFRLVSYFGQLMLDYQPNAPIFTPLQERESPELSPDVELLQALTHEVRTPLTSIRTLTRLLLRRKDLSPEVLKRIESIDRECSDQISRMDLIFRATELESTPLPELVVPLTVTSLEAVFQTGIPRWQRQAQRYKVNLKAQIPHSLPQVWSNPSLLDQVLGGMIEKFVRNFNGGGEIHLQITVAGDQLKVQFHTQSAHQANPVKALGELLMFQPETGCLSLNWDVTKNLFQLLGGKLTIRRRSPSEEVLTIYLKCEQRTTSSQSKEFAVPASCLRLA